MQHSTSTQKQQHVITITIIDTECRTHGEGSVHAVLCSHFRRAGLGWAGLGWAERKCFFNRTLTSDREDQLPDPAASCTPVDASASEKSLYPPEKREKNASAVVARLTHNHKTQHNQCSSSNTNNQCNTNNSACTPHDVMQRQMAAYTTHGPHKAHYMYSQCGCPAVSQAHRTITSLCADRSSNRYTVTT